GSTQTILIADDDPTVVQLLTLTLQPEGFRLLTASDGETALRMARAERPALILLDWQMPGADGMAVTRALRADADPNVRDVPVVLLTGQTGAENTAMGFESGVTDYLTKPFKPTHVRTRVRAWLLRRATPPGPTCRESAAPGNLPSRAHEAGHRPAPDLTPYRPFSGDERCRRHGVRGDPPRLAPQYRPAHDDAARPGCDESDDGPRLHPGG